jgi:tRNA (Thr-GGU) A37 N-methylase
MMHKVNPKDYRAEVHPRGRDDLPLTGVLATHGRTHPNPIGLAVVELFGEKGQSA